MRNTSNLPSRNNHLFLAVRFAMRETKSKKTPVSTCCSWVNRKIPWNLRRWKRYIKYSRRVKTLTLDDSCAKWPQGVVRVVRVLLLCRMSCDKWYKMKFENDALIVCTTNAERFTANALKEATEFRENKPFIQWKDQHLFRKVLKSLLTRFCFVQD